MFFVGFSFYIPEDSTARIAVSDIKIHLSLRPLVPAVPGA